MKKIVFFVVVLSFVLGIYTTAFAAEKEYTIESAVIDVVLQKDGSADIVETWKVNYEKGDFSRFYKSLYFASDASKEEYCPTHTFHYVKIDGIECQMVDTDKDRKDYTYYTEQEDGELMYNIYLASRNCTRTYEIAYNRKDVIKQVGDDYYIFTHRFMCKGFKNNVEKIIVNFRSYDEKNSSLSVDGYTAGSVTGNDTNRVSVSATDRQGLFKIRVEERGNVRFDIPNSSRISSGDVKSIESEVAIWFSFLDFGIALLGLILCIYIYRKRWTSLKIVACVLTGFCLMFVFGWIKDPAAHWLMLFGEIVWIAFVLRALVLKISLIRDITKLKNRIYRWTPSMFSPAVFTLHFDGNDFVKFFVCLSEAYAQGFVKFDDGFKNIYTDGEVRTDMDACVQQVLLEVRNSMLEYDYKFESEKYMPFSCIKSYFSERSTRAMNCVGSYMYKETLSGAVHFAIDREDADIYVELKEDVKYIKRAFAVMDVPFVSYEDVLKNPLDTFKLMCYMYSCDRLNEKSAKKLHFSPVDNIAVLSVVSAYATYKMIEANNKSSSGSSCSSCSGCGGGCGGCGGAD